MIEGVEPQAIVEAGIAVAAGAKTAQVRSPACCMSGSTRAAKYSRSGS